MRAALFVQRSLGLLCLSARFVFLASYPTTYRSGSFAFQGKPTTLHAALRSHTAAAKTAAAAEGGATASGVGIGGAGADGPGALGDLGGSGAVHVCSSGEAVSVWRRAAGGSGAWEQAAVQAAAPAASAARLTAELLPTENGGDGDGDGGCDGGGAGGAMRLDVGSEDVIPHTFRASGAPVGVFDWSLARHCPALLHSSFTVPLSSPALYTFC